MRTHIRVGRTILSVAVLLLVPHCRAAIVDPLADGPSVVDSPDAGPTNPFTISDLPTASQNQPAQPSAGNTNAQPSTQPPSGNNAPEVLPSPASIPGTPAPATTKAPPDP